MKAMTSLLPGMLMAAIIAACGGGGAQVAEGGIGGTGITFGRVAAFGSIFVNGVEYATSSATVRIEEQAAAQGEAALAVGMIVKVTGNVNSDGVTGSASLIEYSDSLEGRVDANDITINGTLTVMGQTVQADSDTVYAGSDCTNAATLESIAVGAVVEVSGYTDGNGLIYASRIACKLAVWSGEAIELKGKVAAVDAGAKTLTIGAQTIAWDAATLPDGTPQNGWYVEVHGDSFNGAVFEADIVELEDDGDIQIGVEGDELELQGIVTTTLANSRFGLNGQMVEISAATQFEGGGQADIQLGRRLKAKGSISSNLLVAEKIELESAESEKQQLEGLVEALDLNAGTLVLLGQTIRVDSETTWEDELGGGQTFSLQTLAIGNFIKANVNASGNGWLASKVKRDNDPGRVEIEGAVQQVSGNQITVVGVRVDLSPPACAINPLVNDRVEVAGVYSGGVLTASIGCEIK